MSPLIMKFSYNAGYTLRRVLACCGLLLPRHVSFCRRRFANAKHPHIAGQRVNAVWPRRCTMMHHVWKSGCRNIHK